MSLFVRLKQYKNKTKSSYGKYYTEAVYTGEVTTREIAKAVSENTTFRPGEVRGLIDEIVAEMKRQLQNSNIVVIDGLEAASASWWRARALRKKRTSTCSATSRALGASSCLPASVTLRRRATNRTAE